MNKIKRFLIISKKIQKPLDFYLKIWYTIYGESMKGEFVYETYI